MWDSCEHSANSDFDVLMPYVVIILIFLCLGDSLYLQQKEIATSCSK